MPYCKRVWSRHLSVLHCDVTWLRISVSLKAIGVRTSYLWFIYMLCNIRILRGCIPTVSFLYPPPEPLPHSHVIRRHLSPSLSAIDWVLAARTFPPPLGHLRSHSYAPRRFNVNPSHLWKHRYETIELTVWSDRSFAVCADNAIRSMREERWTVFYNQRIYLLLRIKVGILVIVGIS